MIRKTSRTARKSPPPPPPYGVMSNMPLWSCSECGTDQYAVDQEGCESKPSHCAKCQKPTKFHRGLGWCGAEHDDVLRALVAKGWKLQWEVMVKLGAVPTSEIFSAILHALKVRGVIEGQHATFEMTDVLTVNEAFNVTVVTADSALKVWRHIQLEIRPYVNEPQKALEALRTVMCTTVRA